MNTIIVLLISFSACYLVATSHIIAPIRNYLTVRSEYLGKLIGCIQCLGFWTGVFFSILSYFDLISVEYFSIEYSKYPFINFIIWGLLSSLFSVLANSFIFYLNSRDTYIIEKK